MQKNEDDILEIWINYHAKLVGYNNLYIIDNLSTDNSINILKRYEKIGINFLSYDDYKKKGDFIYNLIKSLPAFDIAIPLDIDEFIVLEENTEEHVTTDISKIRKYLNNLQSFGRYSFKYYLTSKNTTLIYNSLYDLKYFDKITNMRPDGDYNKKFFTPNSLIGLDHGNHHGNVKNITKKEFIKTNLVLIHYHYRGIHKLIEKCINDIIGLGHDIHDIKKLKSHIKNKVNGAHNIETYLNYFNYGPHYLLSQETGILLNLTY